MPTQLRQRSRPSRCSQAEARAAARSKIEVGVGSTTIVIVGSHIIGCGWIARTVIGALEAILAIGFGGLEAATSKGEAKRDKEKRFHLESSLKSYTNKVNNDPGKYEKLHDPSRRAAATKTLCRHDQGIEGIAVARVEGAIYTFTRSPQTVGRVAPRAARRSSVTLETGTRSSSFSMQCSELKRRPCGRRSRNDSPWQYRGRVYQETMTFLNLP